MRLDRLGDLVVTLPAIYSVHKNFPNAMIDLVVNKHLIELVEDIPFVRNVYAVDPFKLNFFELGVCVLRLRKQKYDLAIDLLPRACNISSILLKLICADIKIGCAVGLRKYVVNIKVPPTNEVKYARDLVFDILKFSGIRKRLTQVKLPINVQSKKSVDYFLSKQGLSHERPLIGICPGASLSFKMWPWEKYAELIQLIKKKYAGNIIVIGSKAEQDLCEKIKNAADRAVINTAGTFGIKQACACIQQLDLFIGNNSGPMHIAQMYDIPSIIVSGFANPRRWVAQKNNSVVVTKDKRDFESEGIDASTITEISVEDVFKEVKRLLDRQP